MVDVDEVAHPGRQWRTKIVLVGLVVVGCLAPLAIPAIGLLFAGRGLLGLHGENPRRASTELAGGIAVLVVCFAFFLFFQPAGTGVRTSTNSGPGGSGVFSSTSSTVYPTPPGP